MSDTHGKIRCGRKADDDDERLPFWLMGISICSPRMALWNPWSIPPFFFFFLLDFPDLGRSPSCAFASVRAFELLCSNQPHPMLVRDCELLPALEEDRADDEDDWARDSLESSPLDEAGRFLMMLLSDTFFCFCCAVLALASAAFLSAAFVAGSDSRAVDRSPPPTLMVLLLGVPPPAPVLGGVGAVDPIRKARAGRRDAGDLLLDAGQRWKLVDDADATRRRGRRGCCSSGQISRLVLVIVV